MRGTRWARLGLVVGTLATAVGVPGTANAAGATLSVAVGDVDEVSGVALDGMRFYAPANLTVHTGDTLDFVFRGFHTATLIPVGENAEDWRAAHASAATGPASAYSPTTVDADETGMFLLNTNVVLPTDPDCGATTTPCVYDGSAVVNSGLPIAAPSFAVSVAAAPGSSFWVVSLLHDMMQAKITVIAADKPTTTQKQVDDFAAAVTARDKEAAAALLPRLQTQTRHETAGGRMVWDAYAGYDGPGWSLDGMFPRKLRIEKSEKVRWHFDQLTNETHSVTFPRRTAARNALSFNAGNVACEADPTDTPPDAPSPTFCSSGRQDVEFHLPAAAVLPRGTSKYGGKGLHSSGIRGSGGISRAPYTVKFVARSGDSPFRYACSVHGRVMTGKVVVR